MKIIRVVGGVILNSQNHVLIAKRKASQANGGYWEFPGGKVESGESDLIALKRELTEELGIHVEVGEFIASSFFQYEHFKVELFTYFIKSYTGKPTALEHEEVCFMEIHALEKLSFTPANLKTINVLTSQFI